MVSPPAGAGAGAGAASAGGAASASAGGATFAFFLRGLKKSFIFCTNVGRAQTEPQMEFESPGLLWLSARLFWTQSCGAVCVEAMRSAVRHRYCQAQRQSRPP